MYFCRMKQNFLIMLFLCVVVIAHAQKDCEHNSLPIQIDQKSIEGVQRNIPILQDVTLKINFINPDSNPVKQQKSTCDVCPSCLSKMQEEKRGVNCSEEGEDLVNEEIKGITRGGGSNISYSSEREIYSASTKEKDARASQSKIVRVYTPNANVKVYNKNAQVRVYSPNTQVSVYKTEDSLEEEGKRRVYYRVSGYKQQ